MQKSALIVDDEPDIRQLIALSLIRVGVDAHVAANLSEAKALLAERAFDVCLSDVKLPDGSGLDFVTYVREAFPELPIALLTAHGNIADAVEAMRRGAFDFVTKPVDLERLRRMTLQAMSVQPLDPAVAARTDERAERRTAETENREGTGRSGEVLRTLAGRERLVGDSAPVRRLLELIAKVSRTNAPVWITGESGTGKELIARLIHENSARAAAPFVAVNCGAVPAELMESEFFGHRKGSFTGASDDRDGLFRASDGGTLFLDEVAELPLHMQVKLLRAIQERSVRPVGGRETPVDIRLLSASHKDLAVEVEHGRFRHDLYYRLNVISLKAPALRERAEDIPVLARHILERVCRASGRGQAIELADEAVQALKSLDFPGNVRELENLLERAVTMTEGSTIRAADLVPDRMDTVPSGTLSLEQGVDSRAVSGESDRILAALERTRWNRKAAAEELGLTYRQLRYRIQQLDIGGPGRP